MRKEYDIVLLIVAAGFLGGIYAWLYKGSLDTGLFLWIISAVIYGVDKFAAIKK